MYSTTLALTNKVACTALKWTWLATVVTRQIYLALLLIEPCFTPTMPIFWTDATDYRHRCKTNTASNTAYRGFGGPQGMMAIERSWTPLPANWADDPLAVRKTNYYGKEQRNVTHYYQTVEHNMLQEITAELEQSADYHARRQAIRPSTPTARF